MKKIIIKRGKGPDGKRVEQVQVEQSAAGQESLKDMAKRLRADRKLEKQRGVRLTPRFPGIGR